MTAMGYTEVEGLHVRDLSKSFRSRAKKPIVAASRVSFDVPFGTILALVGPSGCGKTTTLRAIAGLERLDDGSIRLAGQDITQFPPQRRDIAMVFQKSAALPHLSGRENLELTLKLRKFPAAERAKRVDELAERLSLSGVLDRKIGAISGGESQRVALGRALLTEPRAMLLDEPSHFLDPRNRRSLWRWIREIVAWRKLAAVVVTHDPREALALGDQIAVMRDGEIVEIGERTEIYRNPQTLEAATALSAGCLNTLDGELNVAGGKGTFASALGGLTLQGVGVDTPGPATLAVRPDALQFAPSEGTVSLTGQLEESRDVGFARWRTLRMESALWTIESTLSMETPIDPASFTSVHARSSALMLFHRDTGRRIAITWTSGD